MSIINLFTSWQGRIGRLTYLLCVLSLVVVNMLVAGIFMTTGLKTSAPAIYGAFVMIMNYPAWVVAIKRAHDLDKSGWWLLGWTVLPVVGAFGLLGAAAVSTTSGSVGLALIMTIASVPLSLTTIWTSIKVFFYNGTPGVNGFGASSDFLRKAFGGEDDMPMPAAAGRMSARVAMTPPPAPAPKAALAQASARPARSMTASGSPRPAGFGRRGSPA